MLLTGQTRSSLHLAPGGNVCDGGKLCFSTSLILLWLTVSFCFRHIGLSIQRSKDRLGIRNVIFPTKLCGKSVALMSLVTPLLIIQGGKGLNPQSLKLCMFPFSLNRRKTVSFAINRKRLRERFTPIVPPHNVRVNTCMSPKSEIVFTSFTAGNITANNVLYVSGALCSYSLR